MIPDRWFILALLVVLTCCVVGTALILAGSVTAGAWVMFPPLGALYLWMMVDVWRGR